MTRTSPTTSASPKTPPSPTQSELPHGPQGWSPKVPPAHTWLCHHPMSLSARTQRFLQGPFAPGADLCFRTLAVSPDGKLLFSGGHWDNSLRVTSLAKGKVVGHITRHIGTSSADDEGPMMPRWVCREEAGDMGAGRGHLQVSPIFWGRSRLHHRAGLRLGLAASPHPKRKHLGAVLGAWWDRTGSSWCPSGCHRCCHLPGTRPLRHLPHFWLPGHHLHGVAGPTAGRGLTLTPTPRMGWLAVGAATRSLRSPCPQHQGGFSSGLAPKPVQVLYGHDAEVTCVAISTELDMAVSGSEVSWGGGGGWQGRQCHHHHPTSPSSRRMAPSSSTPSVGGSSSGPCGHPARAHHPPSSPTWPWGRRGKWSPRLPWVNGLA